ncbi:hypothetical protein [Bifidobacterium leontopitheci]|nr:hypothetical protein [Bifidobacterium leontopitheci]
MVRIRPFLLGEHDVWRQIIARHAGGEQKPVDIYRFFCAVGD